jgi:integrase
VGGTIFKAAVYDRVIAVSPCRAIRLPQVDEHEMVPIGEDVVEALAVGMPGPYRAMIVPGTGLRISEALGLTKDRVDWLRRTVTVDRQLVGVKENRPVFGPVKDKRNRAPTIPVPESLVKALAGHVERFGLGPEDLLFAGPRGGLLRRTTFSDNRVAVAGPLGIPLGDGFHQLRHFYASVLIRAGESVKVVQKRLGHMSAQMTLDVYGHLWPDDDDQTRDAVLGPAGVSRMRHVEAVGE